MRTTVVHCRKSEFDVYIGRPSKWGNPFKIKKGEDRETVINRYRAWLLQQTKLLGEIDELHGKVLGCWCKPELCHGDVLAELANAKAGKHNKKKKSRTMRQRKAG